MKLKALLAMTVLSLTLGSCNSYISFDKVAPKMIGSGAKQMDATVVSTLPTTINSNDRTSIYGSILGAAIGAGAGQMLGGGSGRVVSTVGFGALGMLAGNAAGNSMTTCKAEKVTVKTKGKEIVFTQPIFREFGPLVPGMTGTLYYNAGSYCFVPN